MEVTAQLTTKQYDALDNDFAETFYIGGIGSGKTYVLGAFVHREAGLKGSIGLITAPVSDTLNNSTLPELKNVWEKLGLIEGTHYTIGSMPPLDWGVKKYTNRNSKILTWAWGSYTILDGSDNFNKHRGLELDYVACDEIRDIKDGAWKMYRGRMRGKAKKEFNGMYKMLAVTTPPDDPTKIEMLINDSVNVIRGTSFDNYINLPVGYIENLKNTYDDITYRREVLGELIHSSGQRSYYSFSDENVVSQEFVSNAATVMCWDFNASPKKPMSTQLVQKINGIYYVTKEFIFKNSNTDEQCQKILEFFNQVGFNGTLQITGDYSGNRRESNSSRSDYAIIEYYFSNYSNYTRKARPTLSVRDRVSSLNAQFRNVAGIVRLFIDKGCIHTIEDLYKTRWKDTENLTS